MDLVVNTYRPEYRGGERVERPYPGQEAFARIGRRRDFWVNHRDL